MILYSAMSVSLPLPLRLRLPLPLRLQILRNVDISEDFRLTLYLNRWPPFYSMDEDSRYYDDNS